MDNVINLCEFRNFSLNKNDDQNTDLTFQQIKNYETLDMLPAISAPDATSIEFVNNSPSTLAV